MALMPAFLPTGRVSQAGVCCRMQRAAAFAVTLTLVLTFSSPSTAVPEAPNIRVLSCQVLSGAAVPQRDEIGLAVRFENLSPQTFSSIVWRAKYGPAWIDFIDDGTFSPQVRIDNFLLFEAGKRKFNWLGMLQQALFVANGLVPTQTPAWNSPVMFTDYASYTDPDTCSVVRTISSDGTLWVNPAISGDQPFVFPSPSPKPSVSPSPAPLPTAFASGPLQISYCDFELAGEGYLGVGFLNAAPHTAKRIVFRLPYKDGGVEFTDQGTFSPGTLIKHSLRTSLPPAFRSTIYVPMMKPLDACRVASVEYDDGSTWQNPAIGASPPPLPTPVPDALPAQELIRAPWQLHGFPTPLPGVSPTPAATPLRSAFTQSEHHGAAVTVRISGGRTIQ